MKRILIIGGGSIGERHLRCFASTGRVQVALCDLNDDLLNEVAARYNVTETYVTFDQAMERAFDAAVVCTPAHLHIPMATKAAEHNISILIEKPLSTSLDGIDRLAAEVRQRQLQAATAYVLRHHPALRALKSSVTSGVFGRPVQAVYTGGQHFPFYRPAYREIYYNSHATGGGAIQDALTHVVNFTEWIVGPVTRLVADADHCLLEGVDVEDSVHLVTRHSSVMGSFSLNQHQPPFEGTLTIICEQGAVRFEQHHNRWLSCREPDSAWLVEEEFSVERDDMFVDQANAFLNQLNGNAEPVCSLAEAHQTSKVNLAALKSAESGQWVEL